MSVLIMYDAILLMYVQYNMSEHSMARRGYGLDQSPITPEIQTTVSIRTKNGVVVLI